MSRSRLTGFAPAFAVSLLLLGASFRFASRADPPSNGDELAWRALVESTDTGHAATPAGESAAGWRFWTSRGELFPSLGGTPPTANLFTTYRALDCIDPTLPSAIPPSPVGIHPTLSPARNNENFCESIFLNPALAGAVITNGLYWREGLITYVAHLPAGGFRLPPDARAIKTEWKVLSQQDAAPNYFVARNGTTRYALVALHLISHQLPTSLCATWIHRDYLRSLAGYPITDSFGGIGQAFPSSDLSNLLTTHSQRTWMNYRLIGSQVDATNRRSLANPLIEGKVFHDLNKVSCIACHSQAAIAPYGNWSLPRQIPAGEILPLPTGLTSLDSEWTLVRAPVCEHGITATCSPFTSRP